MMRPPHKTRQAGLTLVELMITITLGMVLMTGVMSVFSSVARYNTDTFKHARIRQELQAVLDLIATEVRKTGSAPYGVTVGSYLSPGDCVLFSYDLNASGALDVNDRFGFRYAGASAGTAQYGEGVTACSTGTWTDLNDANAVTVTDLDIALTSDCVNITDIPNTDCNTTPASVGDKTVRVLRTQITLAGQLRGDATVKRVITTTVQLRNEVIQ